MEEGETSERASETLRELRYSLQDVDASTGVGQVLYEQGLTRVHQRSPTRAGSGCWRSPRACPAYSGSCSWAAGS